MNISGSKVFPIKVEQVDGLRFNIVEWMLGNVCNYNCSYCSNEFKSGNKRFFDLQLYIDVCDKIIQESNEQGKKVWFKFTGGEPTMYPDLIKLLQHIKNTGNYNYLITNGSRTIRFWEEIKEAKCVDFISISHHVDQNPIIDHTIDLVKLFEDTEVTIIVNITCPTSHFDLAVTHYKTVHETAPAVVNLMHIMDSGELSEYTNEQREILLQHPLKSNDLYKVKPKPTIPKQYQYHNGIIKVKYNDGKEAIDHANNFIKKLENNFKGYSCDVGKSFIRIAHDVVQRGLCGVGEPWSIHDKKLFKTDPITCTKNTCNCVLDMLQSKRLEHGGTTNENEF